MKHRVNIVGSALLVLMLLSIMPKTFVHDLFAHHTDVTACNDQDLQGPCIHKQGFNCQQTDLVVPGSYTISDFSNILHPVFPAVTLTVVSSSLHQNILSTACNRGPPFRV